MCGGLYIEVVVLKVLSDLLEESGWTGALMQAGVATLGMAHSFLKASNVTRTRCANQVTACSLYNLMEKSYTEDSLHFGNDENLSGNWCTERAKLCPHFHFWFLILQLET